MTQLAATKIKLILATGTILMAVLSKASQALNCKVAPFIVLLGIEEHLLYASTVSRTIILTRGGVFAVRYVMQLETITDYM